MPKLGMFGFKREPSPEALAGVGPTTTYPMSPSAGITPIVVEDCSPDGTREVLRRFQDPRLRIIEHERNRGHIFGIEEGLRAVRGQYVARIDSDDRYRPHFLERTVPLLERYPDVGMVYGDAALIDARGQQTAPASDSHHGGRDFKGNELAELLCRNFVCAPTVIGRTDLWRKHLPVREGLAFSDWYFSLLIAREADFYFVSEVLADYRVHGGNLHTRTIRDRTEEPSIVWMLDKIFSMPEADPARELAKRGVQHRAYATHYWTLAEKYFGAGMNADARRCYWQAIRHQPARLRSPLFWRRLPATWMSRETYERCKRWLRPGSAPA